MNGPSQRTTVLPRSKPVWGVWPADVPPGPAAATSSQTLAKCDNCEAAAAWGRRQHRTFLNRRPLPTGVAQLVGFERDLCMAIAPHQK